MPVERTDTLETGVDIDITNTELEGLKSELYVEKHAKSKIFESWVPSLETTLKNFGERSAASAKLHYFAFRHYVRVSNRFAYSNIILSVLAGAFGFSSSGNQTSFSLWISLTIAVMNIMSAMISSFQKFLQSEQKSEKHNSSYIEYSTLYRDISLELSLSREDRVDAVEFLKICKSEYDRIHKKSPPVPRKIIVLFKKIYPDRVNNPEQCNGMTPININSPGGEDSEIQNDFAKLKAFYKLKFNALKIDGTLPPSLMGSHAIDIGMG